MSQTTFIRFSTATTALIAGLAAGALAVPLAEVATGTARPAHAFASARAFQSSPFDTQPVKTVRVVCPGATVPYSGGGAVNYGPDGGAGVALTTIAPNPSEQAVIVTAAAPAGQTGAWSVVAFAICSTAEQPGLVVRKGLGAASATCPGPTQLVGVGFKVDADPAASHVTGVNLNQNLTGVRVTAGGPGVATAEVTAVAVCRTPGVGQKMLSGRNSAAGWPKTATVQDTEADLTTYPVGAEVIGPEAATLDALVPGAEDGASWARGTLYGATPVSGKVATAADDDDDGSVTVEAGLIGTFL